ncbi:MAG: hypothetical protein V3V01_15775 [Acidimicrobiales bacterium]
MSGEVARPDRGSFRDPLSKVYIGPAAAYRTLDPRGLSDFVATAKAPFFKPAMSDGKIVATKVADPVPDGIPEAAQVLEHELIPFVSYPYEWPFSMLKDAALLHLDVVRLALADGIITKDGSSYNIQWRGAQPTFIDVGSFEPVHPGEPWFGYRQFCQLFLYPLLLQSHRNLPFQQWLRGSVDGITPADCRAALRRRDLVRRGVFSHVYLQSRLEASYAGSSDVATDKLKRSGFTTELVQHNIEKLYSIISKLKWRQANSEWSNYSERGHYTDNDLEMKRKFVVDVASLAHRRVIVDLGCNDGYFSKAVLDYTDYVVAVDSDPLVVDLLYRELSAAGEQRILPLAMNLADPSPGLGWRGAERAAFLGRHPVDLSLALAVVHHLSISNNVPLSEIVSMFSDLGGEVVVEFPHPEDEKVQTLLRNKRAGIHDGYTLENFEAQLSAQFEIVSRALLPSGTRTIYHARPR